MKVSPNDSGLRTQSAKGFQLASIVAVCLLFFCSALPLRAQTVAKLQGTVTDSTGAAVPAATVTVTNDATTISRQTVTSTAGTYIFTDLLPGAYTVKVEKTNFRIEVIKGIDVETAQTASADVSLKTGSVSETVEVSSDAVTLETAEPQLSTTIENKLITELPVEIGGVNGGVESRGRQIDDYLFLAPGVTGGEFSHRINGGLDQQNEVIFNGIVAVQSETQGFQTHINPPFEMVGEFSVVQGTFSAQYGLSQGAASYQFASGTNVLHGDAFEIMRNSYFDAPGASNDQFNNDKPGTNRQNNYGFTLGGPVWIPHVYNGKDKTFWHFALEKYKFAQFGGIGSVPTPAEVGGDFSGVDNPNLNGDPANAIYVPVAWATDPALANCPQSTWSSLGLVPGQQFPNNKIPSTCISPVSSTLLGFIPTPDTNTTSGNPVNNKLPFTSPAALQTSWGFTIDQNLNSKQAIHGSFWRDKYVDQQYNGNAAIYNNPLSALSEQPELGTGLFVNYSNAFSNNLVMTAGFGWMGEINDQFNEFPLPGSGFGGIQASAGQNYLPGISFSNHNTPGPSPNWSQGENFSVNRKLGVAIDNNWLLTHDRHTINFGVDIRRSFQDDHECQNCIGSFTFNSRTTSIGFGTATDANGNTLTQTNTGNAFASFLLGDPDFATRSGAAENRLRNFYFAPYIQDNIKVNPKLTVDIGLRWDLAKPFTDETKNTIVLFNPSALNTGAISTITGNPLQGAANILGTNCTGCVGYSTAQTQWRHFSPRFGFAYELNSKMVILGGFSWSYLDGGAFEYGVNKVAANYGNLINGAFSESSNVSPIPAYGPTGQPAETWDSFQAPAENTPVPFAVTLFNGSNRNVGLLPQDIRQPYAETWNFGVQRQLPDNMFIQASYVGGHYLHLPASLINANQLNPNTLSGLCAANPSGNCVLGQPWTSAAGQLVLQSQGFGQFTGPSGVPYYTPYQGFEAQYGTGIALAQALVPYPQYQGIFDGFDTSGAAEYNALQVQLQKRYSNGLSFLAAYTLSQTLSNTDSGFSTFNGNGLNEFNHKAEWDTADNDQTHLLSVAFVYDLPLGPGKRFLDKGGLIAKNLIGGWQISGVLSYASGTPMSLSANSGFGNSPLVYTNGGNRPNIVAGVPDIVNWNSAYYGGLCSLNSSCTGPLPSAISTGAFSSPGPWGVGDAPRNPIRGPFNENENIALAKKLFFGERVSGELRMEFFNIFNRFIVGTGSFNNNVDNGVGSFGVVCAGSVCQGNAPRTGQATFKLNF